jgi:hypothetical protein
MGQKPLFTPTTLTLNVDASANTASGTIHLKNLTDRETTVALSASDFVNQTTNRYLNASVLFVNGGGTPGKQLLDVTVLPGKVVTVRVDVSNAWEAGESRATLYSNGDSIGAIDLLKLRVPFNVKIVAANPDLPVLTFRRNQPTQLSLRNDDGMTYRVESVISIRNRVSALDTVLLPPNSSVPFLINPPSEWFDAIPALLKDDLADGHVAMRLVSPGQAAGAAMPSRVIPIKASLSILPAFPRSLVEFLIILLLLALGGTCSLLLRYWVPNSLRRTQLIERLNDLTEATRALVPHTPSDIRVGVRVQRQKLLERLDGAFAFSPESPRLLTEVGRRIDELTRHVQLTHQLNDLSELVDKQFRKGEAVSKLVVIEDELRPISDRLKRFPADLDAITAQLAAVAPKIAGLSDVDAEWVERLKKQFLGLDVEERKQLQDACESCASLLVVFWDRRWEKIKKDEYNRLDTYVRILDLIAKQRIRIADAENREALSEFNAAVKRGDFRSARNAMREIEQGIFREGVRDALIGQEPPAIIVSQNPAREYTAIQFGVKFKKSAMDGCEALGAIGCQWDFGDGLQEACWQPMHYYSTNRLPIYEKPPKRKGWSLGRSRPSSTTYAVRATFVYTGNELANAEGKPVAIETAVAVQPLDAPSRHRTRAEFVQLGIALFIALIGLLAGAREQIQKLDLLAAVIAIFLLGFGADAIKNALTPVKPPEEPAPATP